MKRYGLILTILFSLFLFFNNQGFAYSSQSEKLINAFNKQISSMDNKKKTEYLKLINSILTEPKVVRNANSSQKTLINELSQRTSSELKKTGGTTNKTKSKPSDGTDYQTLANVNFDTIRNTWLSWHNEKRAEKGLEPLKYHSDLEKSATTRATYLANNNITNGTHSRLSSDGYYNYNSIKDWFNSLGIYFAKETGGKSAFSESIGYRGYKCYGGDCTQTVIDSTKKVFDSFINEGTNGAHYKAIMMSHYHYIGLGFQVNPANNTIYTVIHYAEEIVE